ncbi:hypothetical protein AFLA_005309 [Aspergillus flavus NRRL3357]|nr:hypothetical protein AFLA_005309 [Aspergillus flavus NRRL3357]
MHDLQLLNRYNNRVDSQRIRQDGIRDPIKQPCSANGWLGFADSAGIYPPTRCGCFQIRPYYIMLEMKTLKQR